MGRAYRKRPAEEADDDDGAVGGEGAAPAEAEAAPLHRRLEDTRRAQAERTRARGLDVALLGRPAEDDAPPAAGAPRRGADADAAASLRGGLRGTFSAEQRSAGPAEDVAMRRFIEDQLARRRRGGAAAGGAAAGAAGGAQDEAGGGGAGAAAAPAPEAEDDLADRWLTGIQEVEVPAAAKARSLAATEKAMAAAAAAAAASRGGGGAPAGRAKRRGAPPEGLEGVRFALPSEQPRKMHTGHHRW